MVAELLAGVVCLAQNIYHEARGEPLLGQIAVAQVTLNRTEAPGYPSTVCEVVYQPRQFSWTNDGRSDTPRDLEAYNKALVVALTTYIGLATDPVPGATHFYAQTKVQPDWASDMLRVARIGGHTFMKEP